MVSILKIAQISPEAIELKPTMMRLTLPSSVPPEDMTVEVVRGAMKNAGIPPPGVKAALYFKDEEGDFLTLPNPKDAWPSCCISDGLLRAWFMCVPNPPGTIPSEPACACLGPHVHLPDKKKLQVVDYDGFKGYSLLAAASDGCASCVEHWLGNGVDPNFQSSNQEYTAMDCVLWAEKKSQVSLAAAEQVKELLKAAGGTPNKL